MVLIMWKAATVLTGAVAKTGAVRHKVNIVERHGDGYSFTMVLKSVEITGAV